MDGSPVAQLVEHLVLVQKVVGSRPAGAAIRGNDMPAMKTDAQWNFECPRCGVKPRQPCIMPNGRIYREGPHLERMELLKQSEDFDISRYTVRRTSIDDILAKINR